MNRTIAVLSLVAATAFAQTTAERPHFEIASVQRSGEITNPYTLVSGGMTHGARYELSKATMLDLIRIAWDVDPDVVFGGPNWLEFDRFDITAKLPVGAPPATVRLMLQSLLTNRFGLVVHKDTRPMTSFVLAHGKSEPKLQMSDGPGDAGCSYVPQPKGSVFIVNSCRDVTMAGFARQLRTLASDYLAAPVIDSTQIEGSWNFDLKWIPRARLLQPGAERITIFDTIRKDLGLSLTPIETRQPVLIVDRAEQPTPDLPGTASKLPKREVAFEVADLKRSPPDEKFIPGPNQTRGGGLEARALPLSALMATAWDTDESSPERFSGLPEWAHSARFDIHAKARTDANALPISGKGIIGEEVRLMLRNLLIERFRIKWHYENRLVQAWSLVAVKPKLAAADPSKRATCRKAGVVKDDPRDANPILSQLFVCQNATMAQFASQLRLLSPSEFVYPVEDATRLKGSWDLRLNFTPTRVLSSLARDAGTDGAADPMGGISLQDALLRQLGLKLQERRRMLPVIVIDHIEEKPIEN